MHITIGHIFSICAVMLVIMLWCAIICFRCANEKDNARARWALENLGWLVGSLLLFAFCALNFDSDWAKWQHGIPQGFMFIGMIISGLYACIAAIFLTSSPFVDRLRIV